MRVSLLREKAARQSNTLTDMKLLTPYSIQGLHIELEA